MKNFDFKSAIMPSLLTLASIGLSGLFLYLAATRDLTNLENISFQIFALGTGLTGSFIFGRQSASDIVRKYARSAIRRLISLYSSLGHVHELIQRGKSSRDCQVTLARLEETAFAQLLTADDALEEWADVVPEDVAELREKLSTRMQLGVSNND